MLICEENFNNYFSGDPAKTPEQRNHKRYGLAGPSRFNPAWAKHHSRFDIEQEPHEPNRFGWVVEFDPSDPGSVPVKRTALGRLKHEGAGVVLNGDGRVVIYCGDGERFDYVFIETATPSWEHDSQIVRMIHRVLPACRIVITGPITTTKSDEILSTLPVHAC